MLTLEKVRPAAKPITRGTKLFCYETSYSFREGGYYRVYKVENGDIIVKDRYDIEVIFQSLQELKSVFMIVEE
jgi:hypothetical protein